MTRIEYERRRAGLTQKQLAEMIGVTTGTVSFWETGTHEPASSKLYSISKALNVPMESLVGDIEARVGVIATGQEVR